MREKRRRFLVNIMRNILIPYEVSDVYEEELIGEFESQLEKKCFYRFLALIGSKSLVLDLACGDGRHTSSLSKNMNHVLALDLSSNNLRMAKKKCLANQNVSFIKSSMFRLPFRKKVFNGIWFSQAFEYVPPDKRKEFLTLLRQVLKTKGILYMSVESWMYPSFWKSLRELLSDFILFCYWKVVKRKPLLWGEFLYYFSLHDVQSRYSGWHYHVHTDKWTLIKLLNKCEFKILKLDLYDGYIYVLCRKHKNNILVKIKEKL